MASAATDSPPSHPPTVIYDSHHDISQPMRDVIPNLPLVPPLGTEEEPYQIPNIFLKPGAQQLSAPSPLQPQPQNAFIGAPAPSILATFDGINRTNSACGCLPPDTQGDVDGTYYFQWVNSKWALYDKVTGVPVVPVGSPSAYTAGSSFWAGFGGVCQTHNDGDPIVVYDSFAHRWVASQFAVPPVGSNAGAAQCVAISTTSDPLGSYYRYQFDSSFFGDYPKIGIWVEQGNSQDAYLLTTHEFNRVTGDSFVGAAYAALQRDNMLQGLPAAMVRFNGFDSYGVQALHLIGNNPAPSGSCPAFLHFDANTSEYLFWDMCLNWTVPSSSTITSTPTRIAANAPFVFDFFNASQTGTTASLASFGSNTMYRATTRAFPYGAPSRMSLAISHTVLVNPVTGQGAVRWVQFALNAQSDRIFGDNLDNRPLPEAPRPFASAMTKKIRDEGTYAPDVNTRFLPSIAVDLNDNLGVGYSVSSTTLNPQIRTSGRTVDDPVGTLEDETTTCSATALGHQTSSSGRWGDYSTMSVDPTDQCTFWFTTEYYPTTSSGTWSTRICSFKFPGCGTADFAVVNDSPARLEVCEATAGGDPSFNIRVGVLNGFNSAVTLSLSGPAGVTGAFSNSPVSPTPGSSKLTLVGGNSLTAGEYAYTVSGTSPALVTHSVGIQLGVSTVAAGQPTLVSPTNNAAGIKVVQTLTWNAVPGAVKYRVELASDAGFATIVGSSIVTTTTWVTPTLTPTTAYYWRVTPINYCGNGAVSAVFMFTTGVPGQCPAGSTLTNVYNVDWNDNTVHSWTTDGAGGTAWALVATPAAGTGFGTNSFVFFVPDNTTTTDRGLISPAIVIPSAGVQAVILSYDVYHNLEPDGVGCFDTMQLQAKTPSGPGFVYLGPERMFTDPYNGLNDYNAGQQVWCYKTAGTQPGHSIVDLDSFAGQTIQLRFDVASDSGAVAAAPSGVAVDNLKIDVCQ